MRLWGSWAMEGNLKERENLWVPKITWLIGDHTKAYVQQSYFCLASGPYCSSLTRDKWKDQDRGCQKKVSCPPEKAPNILSIFSTVLLVLGFPGDLSGWGNSEYLWIADVDIFLVYSEMKRSGKRLGTEPALSRTVTEARSSLQDSLWFPKVPPSTLLLKFLLASYPPSKQFHSRGRNTPMIHYVNLLRLP